MKNHKPEDIDLTSVSVDKEKSLFGKMRRRRMGPKFSETLIKEIKYKRAAPVRPKKEMNETELKSWKVERNKKRSLKRKAEKKAEIMKRSLSSKEPTKNTCRRRRLADKYRGIQRKR